MKKIIVATLIICIGFINCKKESTENSVAKQADNTLISIVEIPTENFSRAVNFYQSVLNTSIEKIDMPGIEMGVIQNSGSNLNLVLVKGNDYIPTKNGSIIYLNAGNDLQLSLDRIKKNGGIIILPKTEISPEMGFYALFLDSEGNKLGLHSKN